jgi:hypothetical protein
MARILVLSGGVAGTIVANRLARTLAPAEAGSPSSSTQPASTSTRQGCSTGPSTPAGPAPSSGRCAACSTGGWDCSPARWNPSTRQPSRSLSAGTASPTTGWCWPPEHSCCPSASPASTLTVTGQQNIFALGDVTALGIPKTGAVAHFQAHTVVDGLVAQVRRDGRVRPYTGRVLCLVETGAGRATKNGLRHTTPGQPSPPNRGYHWAKAALNRLYNWITIPPRRL